MAWDAGGHTATMEHERGNEGDERDRPDSLVPGQPGQPSGRTTDDLVTSEPVGGGGAVLHNDPSGPRQGLGGGEFADPDTPASGAAPAGGSPERGHGQFDEAYDDVGRDAAGSRSTGDDDAGQVS